jgi:hypothetical protein
VKALLIACALLIAFPINITFTDGFNKAYAAESRGVKKAREKTAKGVVKVVDPAANALVINGKDEIAFTADAALLKDIMINDNVIIKYKEADGKKYAHSVKVDQKKKRKGH